MFSELQRYLREPVSDRVLILYGLRRTGKTTMIRQAILQMEDTMRQRTAFIQISPENTLAHLHEDLRLLESQGFRYVFIDEVTLLDDFIEGAALFSDIFVASGMKIVLSGTDSLGFVFTKEEQLYDRCILLHTTLIPYREFADVLGIADFDRYIRYGGTMSMGGINYNKDRLPFSDQQAVNEYINTSIAQNVQHSLKNYRYGGHFRALRSLYDAGELTGAINRVVEDINHRFAADVLDHIDTEEVTRRLMHLLDIKNQEEQRILPEEIHVREIRSYLALLDLIFEINVEFAEGSIPSAKRTVIAQPGLRFAQSEALITSLLQDHTFRDIPIGERMRISERIVSEIQGRMMEEIILLETMLAFPHLQVCTLQFPVGEFDMVVFDPATISCRLYEIKHSRERAPEQYRHLLDEEKCSIARQL
ncbi:MAG: ATP-binding protein, partial [Lachnospiraceae bacterium]|nr:ATP-binding protein [Lachnospiraceae bacterium]